MRSGMLAVALAVAGLALEGCERAAPPPRLRVIETYLEVPPRNGDDWRTLVENDRGVRYVLYGKLGEPGDEFLLAWGATRAAP